MLSSLVLLLGLLTIPVSSQLTVTSPVDQWGPPASTYSTLQDIDVDPAGNVYVVDSGISSGGSLVWKFSATGVSAGPPYPFQASPTAMVAPYGIHYNNGKVFVADSASRSGGGSGMPRLVVLDASTGATLHSIPLTGTAQDTTPRRLTTNADGSVAYVPVDNIVFVVDVTGDTISKILTAGFSMFGATSVQVDPTNPGRLYVADGGNKRVILLDIASDTVLAYITTPDQTRETADIAFDSNNDLYISCTNGPYIFQMVGFSTNIRTVYSASGLQTGSVVINPSDQVVVGDTESQGVFTFNPAVIHGDPQFMGFHQQSFQVHGASGEFFNLVTSPALQLNSRFIYLATGSCTYNETECWTHPGTYVDQLGLMLPGLTIKMIAGPHSKGMHVMINNETIIPSEQKYHLPVSVSSPHKHIDVHYISKGHIMITTPIISMDIMNSDNFFNLGFSLHSSLSQILHAGRSKRQIKSADDLTTFYPDFPLHGLVGQTWRNARYADNRMYQGDITDYMLDDSKLMSTRFTYNLYQQ